jgi:hypothetical protein
LEGEAKLKKIPKGDFTPAAPKQVWTADMTYIWTDEGWLG